MKRYLLFLFPVAGMMFTGCQTTAPGPFERADANADGGLSREEAVAFLVWNNFEALDFNKDGKVTKEEWNPTNDKDAAKLFAERDLNKDGGVTFEEALSVAKKKGTYDSVFDEADTNRDGKVTRKEALAYVDSKEGPVR